jgi:RHS repeat-associated protein
MLPTHPHRYLKALAQGLTLALAIASVTPALAATPITTYYHLDALGSPVAATDAQGNLVWTETYTAYGEQRQQDPNTAPNTRWYTGKPIDPDTGLSYFGARWYDSSVGRFMGVDPVSISEKNLHSFNRYNYGNNNPYKYIDPDGREPLSNYADPQAELEERSAGRGEFGPDFLDYSLSGFDFAVPLGGGLKLGGKLLEGGTSGLKINIHLGKQGKHIPGHPNFQPGKSELTHPDPQKLLDKFSGKGERIGNKEYVDFGENIGTHVLKDGTRTSTTRGTIHYDEKGGAHIVPAPPKPPY